MNQLFHNEDCTQFFYYSDIPDGQAGEVIDRYVDVMADAGITVFLVNTQSRRTNYRSDVWEAYWDGYDPTGPDDQPFLAPIPKDQVSRFRYGVGNMLKVHRQGVDYPARVIARCRSRKVSPWITLRMNDCHCNDNMDHPFHGTFWKKNPQFYRKNAKEAYFSKCLDYAHPEVRDYYMAIVAESLNRYDIDGLELDFMREPYLFSEGQEAEGAPILTAWLREVRKRVAEAAATKGHPIRLGVRVPSRPEVASAWGLDVEAWVREGLIDLLVPTPRWETVEFDMPIREWRAMIGAAKVTLAGGLEVNYSTATYPGQIHITPELAAGAAIRVLAEGADAVYLFNYFQIGHPFWSPEEYRKTLRSMISLDTLKRSARTIGITYRDILAPGEHYRRPLPATGREVVLSMNLGPIPDSRWTCELLIGLPSSPDAAVSAPPPLATVNGQPCELLGDVPAVKQGHVLIRAITFKVPLTALTGIDVHRIKVISQTQEELAVHRAEVAFKAPKK